MRTILYIALASLVVLISIVWLTPLPFTACAPDSKWCTLAYLLTSSGGTNGFFVLLLTTGFFYASTEKIWKQKILIFLKSVISLCLFFGGLAFVNEHFTKPVLKAQRPSHIYMLNQTGLTKSIDSLYQLSETQRRNFFATLIKNNPVLFSKVDLDVQQHWVDESGYSFPSGHSFNAFLFAMIISYAIYFNRHRPRWRNLFFIPFLWALSVAISRVAIGAHTALDVSAGASLGIAIGALFLYIDFTRHWLTRKN